jgi:signal transduction histidine kinase
VTGVALTAVVGWVLAGGALAGVVLLRRRLALVARAEHELRGPVTVLALAGERLRRDRAAEHHAFPLECELARLCQGLDDLAAARHGTRARPGPAATPAPLEALARSAVAGWAPLFRRRGRSPRVSWEAGPSPVDLPRGRAAQALGNLLANAAEHGSGGVEVSGRSSERGVRVEVRSPGTPGAAAPGPGRGRGLRIAREAAEDAGGTLEMKADGDNTVVALDLPRRDGGPEAA